MNKYIIALMGLMLSLSAGAATIGTTTLISDGYKYLNTERLFGVNTGPDETYVMLDFVPNAISDATIATETGHEILNSIKYDFGNTWAGVEDPGFSFTGFSLKAGTETIVGFFDKAISVIYWNTLFTGEYLSGNETYLTNVSGLNDRSHVVFYNISSVPVPAALFVFTPAILLMLGFIGYIRKAKL